MNHFWQKLCVTILLALALIVFSMVSIIRNPPKPQPEVSYLGHDAANPWGGK